jgi:hypothetical protein
MAGPRKVRVPQEDGTITFGNGIPEEERVFQVKDHLVSPRSNDEQEQLLLRVDGARLATKNDEPPGSSPPPASGTPAGGKPQE